MQGLSDDAYMSACRALGELSGTEMSKAFQKVVQEAHLRVLLGMETANVQELPQMQAQALQLRRVLEVLQGKANTMTI